LAVGGQLAVTIGGGVPLIQANNPGLQKLLFAIMFPVALMFQILTGSELITGNFMFFSVAWVSNRVGWRAVLKNWLIVWWGNWVGAITTSAFLAYFPGFFDEDPWRTYITDLAVTKTSQGFGVMLLKGIGCNFMVCMATYLALKHSDGISRIFGIFFPILTFVAIGFEHCVANGFYISCGIYYGAEANFGQFFYKNLIPVTIGNLVGGGLFMGVFNWYLVGMEHKGRYHKSFLMDVVLSPHFYWKMFARYALSREVGESDEEAAGDNSSSGDEGEMKEVK